MNCIIVSSQEQAINIRTYKHYFNNPITFYNRSLCFTESQRSDSGVIGRIHLDQNQPGPSGIQHQPQTTTLPVSNDENTNISRTQLPSLSSTKNKTNTDLTPHKCDWIKYIKQHYYEKIYNAD